MGGKGSDRIEKPRGTLGLRKYTKRGSKKEGVNHGDNLKCKSYEVVGKLFVG